MEKVGYKTVGVLSLHSSRILLWFKVFMPRKHDQERNQPVIVMAVIFGQRDCHSFGFLSLLAKCFVYFYYELPPPPTPAPAPLT